MKDTGIEYDPKVYDLVGDEHEDAPMGTLSDSPYDGTEPKQDDES